MDMPLSLIVTTLGRTEQVGRMLQSLDRQDMKSFEVIVVDQNDDDKLYATLKSQHWSFPLTHLHRPGMRGACRGRNAGWAIAKAPLLLFPDDDCWYPASFLSQGLAAMTETGADFVTGRPVDESGRTINGRFADEPLEITRQNAWVTGIEWLMFIKRASLGALGGFNEEIGVGAATPWQAGEAQDLMFRALKAGMRGVYRPELCGHHEELNIHLPDAAMVRKGRAYARGMGYVLKLAGYGPLSAAYWILRSVANMGRALLRGNLAQFRYYSNWAIGRLEGYLGRPLPL